MEEYQVQRITPCAECRGTGRVSNPAWLDFMEINPPGSLRKMSAEDYRVLLRKHKLVGEPEELNCGACDGTGVAAKFVGMEEVPLVQDILKRLAELEALKNPQNIEAAKQISQGAGNDSRQKFIEEFDEKFGLK